VITVVFPLSVGALVGWVVLPAVAFALVYYPLTKLIASGLVSSYAKADIRKRISAATLDGLLVVSSVILYQRVDSPIFLVIGALYLVVRDMRGQSIGKLLFGLAVIDLQTGKRATFTASLRRNVILSVPGVNIAAVGLEFLAVVRDPQGQRLGDRLAQTQVIEGLGAKELIDEFQRWWQGVAGDLARNERRRRVPSVRLVPWSSRSVFGKASAAAASGAASASGCGPRSKSGAATRWTRARSRWNRSSRSSSWTSPTISRASRASPMSRICSRSRSMAAARTSI
jgi:uncharacterized RDD family membrane protein YckC